MADVLFASATTYTITLTFCSTILMLAEMYMRVRSLKAFGWHMR